MLPKLTAWRDRIPGRAYLLLAVIIFAASNALIRILTNLGAMYPIDGRNPISFCNVLFVGNLIALIVLTFVYRSQLTRAAFVQLTPKDWSSLVVVSLLSGALAPSLIFMALELTAVNNVVLLGRIEPPLALVLAIVFAGDRVGPLTLLGSAISFVGVVLTLVLQAPSPEMMQSAGFSIGKGEVFALLGAIALAISTLFSRIALKNVQIGVFSVIRTMIGTTVFFLVVVLTFPPQHFIDVWSPFLWRWMLVYGGIVVVGGQLCWFTGLKTAGASEVSLASSFSPLAGVLAAFFLLGEAPTLAQYIGGAIILVGIACTQIEVQSRPTPSQAQSLKEIELEVGFKGTS